MKTMTVQELNERLKKNDIFLVDVREPEEYAQMSIPGSHLMPLATFSYDQLPVNSNTIVIHCHSGKRSAMACDRLLAEHPQLEVYNVEGGILAWKAAGYA